MAVGITAANRVEVCVWIAKDASGKYTNAFSGATNESEGGRVGHVALKIFPTIALQATYSSLMMPAKDHIYVSSWPGRFVKTLDDDIANEGGLPNAIIRLNNLNVSNMLKAFMDVVDIATWTLKSKAAAPLGAAQSCAGFVYKLLEIGEVRTINGNAARYAGPRKWDFYYQTNSHLGDILGGIFNSFGWRGWAMSPKLVLHIAASAAEGNATDKAETINLMSSAQVEQAPTAATNGRAIAGATVGAAAIVAVGFVAKKKFG